MSSDVKQTQGITENFDKVYILYLAALCLAVSAGQNFTSLAMFLSTVHDLKFMFDFCK